MENGSEVETSAVMNESRMEAAALIARRIPLPYCPLRRAARRHTAIQPAVMFVGLYVNTVPPVLVPRVFPLAMFQL
jgi:hypothetical protein